jgi:hypothetical protein
MCFALGIGINNTICALVKADKTVFAKFTNARSFHCGFYM